MFVDRSTALVISSFLLLLLLVNVIPTQLHRRKFQQKDDVGSSSSSSSPSSDNQTDELLMINTNTSNDNTTSSNRYRDTNRPDVAAENAESSSSSNLFNVPDDYQSVGEDDSICGDYRSLKNVYHINSTTKQWTMALKEWCSVPLPLTSTFLRTFLRNKKIAFIGDSVARNSFVLTTARLCNYENLTMCMPRMPTYEYDIVHPPWNRGPAGCMPNTRPQSPTDTVDYSIKSTCYHRGHFFDLPLRGLTVSTVPNDRNGRRNFIKQDKIGPTINVVFENVSLIYVPINKPHQIAKVGAHLMRSRNSWLQADLFVVSIGPHLKAKEVIATPHTIPHNLMFLRAATRSPILFAEFVHAVGSSEEYVRKVDVLMEVLRSKFLPLNVTLIPQRFATRYRQPMKSHWNTELSRRGCGYYDAQHPAVHCQMLTSELLLTAAVAKIRSVGVEKK